MLGLTRFVLPSRKSFYLALWLPTDIDPLIFRFRIRRGHASRHSSFSQWDSTVIRHAPFYRSCASPERLVGAVETVQTQVHMPLAESNRN